MVTLLNNLKLFLFVPNLCLICYTLIYVLKSVLFCAKYSQVL